MARPRTRGGGERGNQGFPRFSQVIWLRAEATTFAGLCEECLAEPDDPGNALAYRTAKVAGRLRREADVGFTRCDRGHPIRVRRLGRPAA